MDAPVPAANDSTRVVSITAASQSQAHASKLALDCCRCFVVSFLFAEGLLVLVAQPAFSFPCTPVIIGLHPGLHFGPFFVVGFGTDVACCLLAFLGHSAYS